MNFGYTQVLFVGSVPRINCLLAIVPSKKKVNDNTATIYADYSCKHCLPI